MKSRTGGAHPFQPDLCRDAGTLRDLVVTRRNLQNAFAWRGGMVIVNVLGRGELRLNPLKPVHALFVNVFYGQEGGNIGRPLELMPQQDYERANEKPLNKHGHGPFCRFSIPHLPACPGLYAVTVDRRLAYVGIATKSLRQRWGTSGYAKIQPVNCYSGGQSTNCKINHAILLAVREEQIVELWIREESNPRPLEVLLIRELDPPWNDQR